MRDINKVILIGRLGKDPDVVNFESGTKKVTFPLATGESYTDRSGQRVDHTEWHNVVMWRRLAEIAEQYLRKGDPVYIEGKMKTRNYEKDGEKRYITEVEVLNLSMLGSKSDSENRSNNASASATPASTPAANPTPTATNTGSPTATAAEPSFDDDLPF